MILAVSVASWWRGRASERRAGSAPLAVAVPVRVPVPVAVVDPERTLAEAIERARASTVALEYGAGNSPGGRRVATGVVVSDQGDVLSVRVSPPEGSDRDSILARDSSGHRHPARWVASDPETGLTLLKLEAHDLRPIRPSVRTAALGAAVFLVGNPYGLPHSVSRGHVSGLSRRLEIGPRPLGGLIQVQAPLHPGDSGALLADMQGGWLGMVRGGLAKPGSKEKDDDDLGFAIPADDAIWVAGQLRDHQKVDRAFLGIKLQRDTAEPGAEVASVIAETPAEKAKLQPGDRIIKLDDQEITTTDDLTNRLDRTRADTEVTLELIRGESLERLTIRTASRPKPPASSTTVTIPAADSVSPPSPPKPTVTPSPSASVRLPQEVIERIERLERQLDEYRRRESQQDARSTP